MRAYLEEDEPRDVHLLSCAVWWSHGVCTCPGAPPTTAELIDRICALNEENRQAS